MKCQILFSGENKKNIANLSSAELAKTVVNVKSCLFLSGKGDDICSKIYSSQIVKEEYLSLVRLENENSYPRGPPG